MSVVALVPAPLARLVCASEGLPDVSCAQAKLYCNMARRCVPGPSCYNSYCGCSRCKSSGRCLVRTRVTALAYGQCFTMSWLYAQYHTASYHLVRILMPSNAQCSMFVGKAFVRAQKLPTNMRHAMSRIRYTGPTSPITLRARNGTSVVCGFN